MNKQQRIFVEPAGALPKEYYVYAVIGAVSTLLGALVVAWRNSFALEPWQWGALCLSPAIGAIIMVAIMTRKKGGE
jgi:hypothetical protein